MEFAWSDNQSEPSKGWETITDSIQTPEKASGTFYLHIRGEEESTGGFRVASKPFKLYNEKPGKPSIDVPEYEAKEPVKIKIEPGDDDHMILQRKEPIPSPVN